MQENNLHGNGGFINEGTAKNTAICRPDNRCI